MWKIAFRKFEGVWSSKSRPYPFKFFKACLPQMLLDRFLNTLTLYGSFLTQSSDVSIRVTLSTVISISIRYIWHNFEIEVEWSCWHPNLCLIICAHYYVCYTSKFALFRDNQITATEAALHRCSYKKVFWIYAANLQ